MNLRHQMKMCVCACMSLFMSFGAQADYSQHELGKVFLDRMEKEHKFDRTALTKVLASAEKKQKILDAMARPAEKTKPWHEYRNIFINDLRITRGAEFWRENAETLVQAEKTFGVPAEIITAIIGVETNYGRNMGSYRVLDALATLGFDYPRRAKFFQSELEHFLLLTREYKKDPLDFKGSYAGAMGFGQFMPSSYRRYSADHDKDGFADIWTNKQDAIASVANYFKAHGWTSGQPVLTQAKVSVDYQADIINSIKRPKLTLQDLQQKGYSPIASALPADKRALPLRYTTVEGDEYWLGFNNFYVITRYNRSRLYARTVWELSKDIEKAYAQQLADEKKALSSTTIAR